MTSPTTAPGDPGAQKKLTLEGKVIASMLRMTFSPGVWQSLTHYDDAQLPVQIEVSLPWHLLTVYHPQDS